MAWDSKASTRRRQNSASLANGGKAVGARPPGPITPKSTHVGDAMLQPFLAPTFDPADFLNASLPALQTPSTHASSAASLSELSTQTQTLLSQLSAHTTRLTTTLTQLTDEILRSGTRLAYEVEVLRGETLGLAETVTDTLRDDVERFVPEGLESNLVARPPASPVERKRRSTLLGPAPVAEEQPIESTPAHENDPEYIKKLRTLTLVRSRLDAVVKTFGDAMAWTFPPSEVSMGSAFLSVSAPEPGSDLQSVEEKGQQVMKELRTEIADLLVGEDAIDAVAAAAKRVEELKELARLWKGTAEEKARVKFVESLAKMVEDRHRELLREEDAGRLPAKKDAATMPAVHEHSESRFGSGLLTQLQRMRGGL